MRRKVDLALRALYFAIAPFFLVVFVTLFPVMGVVMNMILALLVFTFAATFRRFVDRWPLLRLVLGGALALEAFYREYEPRPFAYYVFYPVLLPFALFNRTARRELALYRGLTVAGFVLLLVGAGWDYYRKWQPEIGFGPFLRTWGLVMIVQAVVSVAFVMPLTTTFVTLQSRGRRGALFSLLAVAVLSSIAAMLGVASKRHEAVQLPTKERMYERTLADGDRAASVRERALRGALLAIRRGDAEIIKSPRASEILGPPIEDARTILGSLYQEDETRCFHLASLEGPKKSVLVLFGDSPGHRKLVWAAVTVSGERANEDDLPSDAFTRLRALLRK